MLLFLLSLYLWAAAHERLIDNEPAIVVDDDGGGGDGGDR